MVTFDDDDRAAQGRAIFEGLGGVFQNLTGNPLGLAFPNYKTPAERIESRIAALDPSLTAGAKGEVVAQIVAEETARGTRRAVASAKLAPPTSIRSTLSSIGRRAGSSSTARSHSATAGGTSGTMVTASSRIRRKQASGSGLGAMTTVPPAWNTPSAPGELSVKLCPAGSAHSKRVAAVTPQICTLARML